MVKVGWRPLVTVAAVIAAVVAVRCYGGSRYERGRRESELSHTDSVRRVVTKSLDSAEKVMVPVLEGLMRENDSLRAESRSARLAAGQAALTARRLSDRLKAVSSALADSTPPAVRTLIDSVVIANDSLVAYTEQLISRSAADSVRIVSLGAELTRWRGHYEDARAALDTAEKEIGQLKGLKSPKRKRFGFRAGVLAGVVVTVGAILAAAQLGH